MAPTSPGTRDSPGRRRARGLLYFLVAFLALFGVWLVLVASLAHPEVAVGAAAALLAASLALAVRSSDGVRFRPTPAWLRYARGVPAAVLRDSALLGLVLVRRLVLHQRPRGAFHLVRLQFSGDDPRAAAWRAFVTLATSVAPNTFIVGFDDERGAVLVHQLVPTSRERLRRSVVGTESPEGMST